MNTLNLLNPYIDQKYKTFQEKICQTKYEILGVKIPILRNIAKKLLKEYDYYYLLNNIDNKYFEEIMLKAIIIGNAKVSYEEKLNLITKFLPLIDNWAVCDILVGELKFIKGNEDKFLNFINPLFASKDEYPLRFAFVILLNYYINDKYIDMVLDKCLSVKSDYYYVLMSISWTLSIALVKYFAKTLEFMQKNKDEFDKWTYNKALQKARESFRIDEDKKSILQKAKIK